jgi:hypothetical protein
MPDGMSVSRTKIAQLSCDVCGMSSGEIRGRGGIGRGLKSQAYSKIAHPPRLLERVWWLRRHGMVWRAVCAVSVRVIVERGTFSRPRLTVAILGAKYGVEKERSQLPKT